MDVSDRRMQVLLTPEAKIASDFSYIRAIFAVVGFVSALARPESCVRGAFLCLWPAFSPIRGQMKNPQECSCGLPNETKFSAWRTGARDGRPSDRTSIV